MSEFRNRTQNRWRGILEHFGIDRALMNGKHQPCPFCGGKDRFRFDDKRGNGTWICSSCGSGSGSDLLMGIKQWSFKEMADQVDTVIGIVKAAGPPRETPDSIKRARMRRLWDESKPVTRGDPVSLWLQNRVGNILFPSCLRYHDRVFYAGDTPTFHPAMIARVDDPDGRPTTIHRTYLTQDGQKARVENQRALMPGSFQPGSAIRLFEPRAGRLAIAEGIETALAVVKTFAMPAWALMNASNLQNFTPPSAVEELYIFADHDLNFAGQAAAYTLARRMADKIKVHVILPEYEGEDWNDVLKRRAACTRKPSESSDSTRLSCDTLTPI